MRSTVPPAEKAASAEIPPRALQQAQDQLRQVYEKAILTKIHDSRAIMNNEYINMNMNESL